MWDFKGVEKSEELPNMNKYWNGNPPFYFFILFYFLNLPHTTTALILSSARQE